MVEYKEKTLALLKGYTHQDEIHETDRLKADLGMDSLSFVMLLVELEENFHFKMDESDMSPYTMETVTDVFALVEKYMKVSV